ncbi:M24 family metallopeptidase [Mycobacterium sp. ML2]
MSPPGTRRGLHVPEGPASAGTLRSGSVMTVEPGVYSPGRGGVRIQDT